MGMHVRDTAWGTCVVHYSIDQRAVTCHLIAQVSIIWSMSTVGLYLVVSRLGLHKALTAEVIN